MKTIRTTILAFTALAGTAILPTVLPSYAKAQDAVEIGAGARHALGLTLYSNGSAVVSEQRGASLPGGEATLIIGGLPETLQRDSLSVAVDGASVDAQRFSLDRLDLQTLLRRHVGKTIRWITVDPQTGERRASEAELLSVEGGIAVLLDEMVQINPPGYPAFATVPDDLAEAGRMTLHVSSAEPVDESAERMVGLRYLAGGLDWQASYTATLSGDGTEMTFQGSATISNRSGMDFGGASVALVAGEVNRESAPVLRKSVPMRAMAMESADSGAGVEQAPLHDYHKYEIQGRVDIPDNEEMKIPLTSGKTVAVDRLYRLRPNSIQQVRRGPGESDVLRPEILLSFENTEADGLGLPLPAGIVRVYDDGTSTAALLGEDRVGHLAVGQDVELSLGKTFDITAERKQTAFRRIGNQGEFEAANEITVKNAKSTAETVEIIEPFYGEWQILEESTGHQPRNSSEAVWTITVPANGAVVLSYRYSVRP
ncbi:DUF4139 domain-containing protein [Hwanghaeella grinnelliae]|uniref:DUF4139 domain-containing protein n=1 Tax=Hwanghaeella grinnelliae TaxID=2500179 RepID=A0A3S2W4X1_9PROT|nr:DUF4139 domain-containing protein [Hwanghaeella grinnelliae]RVU36573.1 DUF4139 domain-containing protein [Hwanghaeella grinnelliae]